MTIYADTHTVHTIYIDIPDDILGKVEFGDQVQVVLRGRGGNTSPKRLTYRDAEILSQDMPTMKRLKKAGV